MTEDTDSGTTIELGNGAVNVSASA